MKSRILVVFLALSLLSASAWAGTPKTYQVTGPILEMKDGVIVVQKGNDKWEIALDGSCKVTGELKVGAKVTIEYRMAAVTATVKAEVAKPAAKKAEPKPKK